MMTDDIAERQPSEIFRVISAVARARQHAHPAWQQAPEAVGGHISALGPRA